MIDNLLERWPTGLPRTVAALIVALALGALVAQVWQWQQSSAARGTRGAVSSATATDATDPLPIILSGNLFGTAASTQSAPSPSAATRQASGYTLRAAFAADAGGGGAIIEANGAEARWYEAGERLADGATLSEVHADHVVLLRDGAKERLDFPKLAQLSLPVSAALPAADAGSGAATLERGSAEPIPADASAEEKARIIRQRLEELRNRARS
jgi:general secretion pathway protein C